MFENHDIFAVRQLGWRVENETLGVSRPFEGEGLSGEDFAFGLLLLSAQRPGNKTMETVIISCDLGYSIPMGVDGSSLVRQFVCQV